jgi:catechol 2,3-dioxygenase-like lactoylglutathione lyase family enzyme
MLATYEPVQIAYHVPDPAAAAFQYARAFGWGPFFLMEHISLERCLYRGKPGVFDHTSAYGQAGQMMVELITQHGEAPSALRDMYAANETGVHHVAYFVPNLHEALDTFRARGLEVALDARTSGGVEFAMVDARAEVGHMIELYEPRADLQRFYDYVRRKSQGWDGADPLRRLTA